MKVYYKPFPAALRGIVRGVSSADGAILIDSTLSAADQDKTLRHELAHLILGHHNREWDAAIEAEADAMAAKFTADQLLKMMQ